MRHNAVYSVAEVESLREEVVVLKRLQAENAELKVMRAERAWHQTGGEKAMQERIARLTAQVTALRALLRECEHEFAHGGMSDYSPADFPSRLRAACAEPSQQIRAALWEKADES